MFNSNEWAKAPVRLSSGGRAVPLDGYLHQPVNTVEVIGLDRGRIALLVAPPRPDEAHATLMAAASPERRHECQRSADELRW